MSKRYGKKVFSPFYLRPILIAVFCMGVAHAQDARQIILEVQKREASKSQRYEGTLEVIGKEHRVATKRWIYQRIGDFGNSKAILRFIAPPDVKGVGLLIVNHTDRASDQWMWRPSIGRDQRIALQDRSTRFFGTDFSFEDLEERDVDQFDFKLVADEGTAWKIETRPRKSSQYTYSYEWIKKDNYTAIKIEAYNKKGLVRIINYRDYEQIKGIWTPRTTEVFDVTRNSHTTLKYDQVDYNLPMKDDEFTVQALRRESVRLAVLLLLAGAVPGCAQSFEQRGFIENDALFFPQSAPNDDGHVVDELLLRWEASYQVEPWLKFSTAIDARADSHRETERKWALDLDDRGLQRPAFSLRRMSATIHKGWFTAELGRQFIRWGKADILNPTDRFAPKDYLTSVVNGDFLGVTAARVTLEAGSSNTVDLVWQPWFTPSRTPLLDQRWTSVPEQFQGYSILDAGARYPGGSQYGARWNHTGSGYEYSLMFFDGFNNLPTFNGTFAADTIVLLRTYPRLRLYGADGAVPLPWVTIKGEAAYYTSPNHNNDEFILYVVQLERQVKEWSLVGGYAGEQVTRSENPFQYSPERGFARSFVGHAGWTIDTNRNLILETAIRGGGSFVRLEYSQATGQHWTTTVGGTWLRGDMADFLGQYRRNSYLTMKVRYSF